MTVVATLWGIFMSLPAPKPATLSQTLADYVAPVPRHIGGILSAWVGWALIQHPATHAGAAAFLAAMDDGELIDAMYRVLPPSVDADHIYEIVVLGLRAFAEDFGK